MRKLSRYIYAIGLILAGATACAQAAPPSRHDFIKGPITVRVLRVIDGDTVIVRAHVWIGDNIDTRVRFAGMDAPEMHARCTRERAMAHDAKDAVTKLLQDGTMQISDIRLGKYAGRVLARVKTTNGLDISHYMIEKGLARPYHGGHRQPWCAADGTYHP